MSLEQNIADLGKPENIDALTKKGAEIYDTRLKTLLEPDHNGEFVAIHIGSGDYYVARTASAASRMLLESHPPDGLMVLQKIGNEPEYALASRLFPKDIQANVNK